jgi:hypothetical protein
MTTDLHQLLLDRLLQQQGTSPNEAPALLRDLSKIVESDLGRRFGDRELETSAFGINLDMVSH